jgi:hypothetical protein
MKTTQKAWYRKTPLSILSLHQHKKSKPVPCLSCQGIDFAKYGQGSLEGICLKCVDAGGWPTVTESMQAAAEADFSRPIQDTLSAMLRVQVLAITDARKAAYDAARKAATAAKRAATLAASKGRKDHHGGFTMSTATMIDTSKALLAYTDDDGDCGECTIDEFVDANGETLSEVDLADLAHLEVGQKLSFGGGACPAVEVKRVK